MENYCEEITVGLVLVAGLLVGVLIAELSARKVAKQAQDNFWRVLCYLQQNDRTLRAKDIAENLVLNPGIAAVVLKDLSARDCVWAGPTSGPFGAMERLYRINGEGTRLILEHADMLKQHGLYVPEDH